jgi:hypothetical protein
MKENIDLNRFREFGDIITDTFVVIRQNFKPLFKSYIIICGLFLVVDILISTVVNTDKGESPLLTPMGLLELLFDFVNYTALLLTTLSYLTLYKEKGNQPPDVVEVWGYFKYYFFRCFFTQITMTIAAVIGFLLCFIPFVYLAVVFALITPIMVIENGNLEYSFKKAFKMISGNWWFTFGIMLLVTIIILMVMLVLMLPPMIIYGGSQWLTGKSLGGTAGILQAITINLCQVLWMIPIISSALIYFSLIEEKEANSLINRIKMFGKHTPGADQTSSEQY